MFWLAAFVMAVIVIVLGALAWGPSGHGQQPADEGKE